MTDNQTEQKTWIENILQLRAYLEQEQEVTKEINQSYEKAQAELSDLIEGGNQRCFDLKMQYLEKIQALNEEIRLLQYQANQEVEGCRQAFKKGLSHTTKC